MEVAFQVIRLILRDSSEPPDMTCVARTGNVEFWRADFGDSSGMGGKASVIPYQCQYPEGMSDRNEWHQPHCESLGHFEVWSRGGFGSIFPAQRVPVLQSRGYIMSMQTTTEHSSPMAAIKSAVPTDGFLSGVLESVKDSDNNFFRKFSLIQTRCCAINAQRMKGLASVCQVPVERQYPAWLMGIACLQGQLTQII